MVSVQNEVIALVEELALEPTHRGVSRLLHIHEELTVGTVLRLPRIEAVSAIL